MCREWYNNNRLIFAYTFDLLSTIPYERYSKKYPWKVNQLIDSYKALPDKYIRLYMEY